MRRSNPFPSCAEIASAKNASQRHSAMSFVIEMRAALWSYSQ